MSWKVGSWALNEAPVEQPVQVLILVALSERCNDDGTVAYPSVKTIASKTRVSVRTVHRELKNLEGMGVIRRGDQKHTDHLPPNRRPVVYDLAVEMRRGDNMSYQDSEVTPSSPQEDSGVTSMQPRGDIHDSLGVTPMADNSSLITSPLTNKEIQDIVPVSPALPDWLTYGVADSSRQKLEAQGLSLEDVIEAYLTCGYWTGEPKNQERFISWVNLYISQHMLGKPMPRKDVTEPGNVDEAFHLFWETYPKKERQPVALAAFKAAIKKVTDPMEIITGAQGYARKCKRDGTEEQYMKSPTNWLIDEQWKDKYPAANSDRSRTAADY